METFEKCTILFKVKEGEDSNRRNTRQVFRGLKSESDAEIGQKGAFFKGLLGWGTSLLENKIGDIGIFFHLPAYGGGGSLAIIMTRPYDRLYRERQQLLFQ